MPNSILIAAVTDDGNPYWNIIVDGRAVCEKLCWDEALGRVALLIVPQIDKTHPENCGFKPFENFWEIERKLRDKIMAELRPCDRPSLTQAPVSTAKEAF